MRKSKNKGYRWIAAMMTAALLVGQCHVPVLAQEGTAPAESGISDENGAGAQEDSGQGMGDDASKDSEDGGDQSGADNGGGNDSAEDDGTGNGGTEDGAGNAGSGDGSGNGGAGNDGEGESGAGDTGTGDAGENQGDEEGAPDKCVCETACTEDAVNVDCPVCAADYVNCAKKAGEGVNPAEGTGEEDTVSENDLDGEAGIALMAADEGVEVLAVGEEFTFDGIRYVVTGDSEVKVCKQGVNAVSGNLMIPKLVEDSKGIRYRVTGIGVEAFSWCRLSKVELPEGVTVIGDKAFEHCTSLSKVDLPSSIKIIGERAFSQCALLTSVVIPDGVKSIEDGVFYGCTALNSVTIPDSVTSIGKFAFWKCGGLTSIEIPGNVVRIGENAFQGCVGLTGIEIPKSVTSIESFAFEECTGLTSVEIPENVTSIEMGIFFDCSGLTSVKIPESVTSIGNRPFSGCGKLAGIEIPKNVTSIGWEAFMNCSSLTYVEIPEKVTSIENWTFYGCSSLTKVIISDTVTDIKAKGFYGCAQLKELRIVVSSDGKVQFPKVGEQAFADLPNERYIIFVDKNGKELKGGAYNNAKAAFIEAAKSDNDPDSDPDDGKWYGWSLKEPLGAEDTYRISVNAYKDNQPWNTDCDRIFALTKDNGTTFITNFDAVEAGTYTIYDVTGLNADEFQTKGVNTGVTVPVVDADVSATVDYYTASFYDIDAGGNEVEYGTDTDQRQQTVLKTVERVTRPATNPSKAGHTFDKWVTSPNGDVEFDFATTPVTAPTKIYAKWTKNTAPTYTVTINVKKDKNPWSGHGKTFALLGGGGSGFLEVPGQTGDSTYSLS